MFSTSGAVKDHPSWVRVSGVGSGSVRGDVFVLPPPLHTPCSVWEKSSSIPVPNLEAKRGSFCFLLVFFVSLSMKNYLKNQPPATRGFSLINAKGFSVAQERGRGETTVWEQTNLRAPREVANL